MKRRERVSPPEEMPAFLAAFTPNDWPAPPSWWTCGDQNYRRMYWNRARGRWRRERERGRVG